MSKQKHTKKRRKQKQYRRKCIDVFVKKFAKALSLPMDWGDIPVFEHEQNRGIIITNVGKL